MRVRIQPRMLVYAVYLVEREYQPQGQGQGYQGQGHEEQIPQSPTDNTVHDEPDQPMQIADLQTNINGQELYNQGKSSCTQYNLEQIVTVHKSLHTECVNILVCLSKLSS